MALDAGGSGASYKRPVTNDERYYAAQNQLKDRYEKTGSVGFPAPWEYGTENKPFTIQNLRNKISGVNQLSKFYFDLPKIRNESSDRSNLVKRAWEKTTKDTPDAAQALKNIYFYSENITIPMRGINTDPHVYANGYKFEAPIGTNYGDGDIAITMIVDKDYYLYDFFMNWMNEIHSKDTGYFSFHDQYVTDIDIYQLNNVDISFPKNTNFDNMIADTTKGFVNYKVSLGNCYPKSVTAIEFKHEAANERTKITVGFTYEKIDYINPKKGITEKLPEFYNTDNLNQLEDRYNLAGINMNLPIPKAPPYDPTKDPSLNFGGQGLDPTSLRGPEYNTNDYFAQQQEYYVTIAPEWTHIDDIGPPEYFVGPHESFDPYADNNMQFPTAEEFRRVRGDNYNVINQAELNNIITTIESQNPPQWEYDENSMSWSQNPEWKSEQEIQNEAIEQWFNYTRKKLTIDSETLQEEIESQLEDIERNQETSLYITDENGFAIENPNYDHRRYPGETDEEFAERRAKISLGVVDVPDRGEFTDDEGNFDMESFSRYMADNITNQDVIDRFNRTLPAGMTPTGNPDRKHQTFEEIYDRLKEDNDSLPDEIIVSPGPGVNHVITKPNPEKKTELELYNEAINELAGYGNSTSNVGPETIMVPSKNDGRQPVPASIVNDPNPEVFEEYARKVYEEGGPDYRDFAEQKTEWWDEKQLRNMAHIQTRNNEVSNNLQNLLLNEDHGYTPRDILLHTLPEEMNSFDIDNPQTETQKVKAALYKRLAVGEGTVPLNERETNILIDIINPQYGLSIPHGTNLFENPTVINEAMRGRGFDQELFVHFREKELDMTMEEADTQMNRLNQATNSLNNVVNNINTNHAISMLNRAGEHGQQIQNAKDAAQMEKIEEIRENYRQELNSPTRNFWRDMVEQQRQDRIDKGGNPQYTGREQAIMDAADDGKMTSQDLHTFASVLHQEQIDENRVYRTSLEEGFKPEEVGVNAYYNFQAAKQHTNHETTVHTPVTTEEERFRIAGKSLAQQLRESQAAAGYASNLDVPTDQLQLMSYLKRYEELGPDERNRVLVVTRAIIEENRENQL